MKIAVTSQNRKTITSHAGKCRRFWIFQIENKAIVTKELLELTSEQTFHASSKHEPHPLDGMDVFITGGMGQGMVRRLNYKEIQGLITEETDPEKAITLFLAGELKTKEPEPHHHTPLEHEHEKEHN